MAKSKRRSGKRSAKKSYKRAGKQNFQALVKSSAMFVLPPRFKTKMALSATMSAAVGTLPAGGSYFCSYGNGIYQPLSASPTYTSTFTSTQGSTFIKNPVGFAVLSGMYYRYKVTNVSYDMQVCVGSNTDAMAVYIYPFNWATGAAGLDPYNAQSQPGCKYKVMNQSGASSSHNRLKVSYNIAKYLGMTKTQFGSQIDTPNVGYPTQLLGVCFSFEPLTGTTNVQPVSVDLRCTYTVEWSNPLTMTA